MTRTTLVTGAAGYVGSHAVKCLRENNRAVIALDDLSTGNRWAVPDDVPLTVADFADPDVLPALHRRHGFDSVFHFAAKTSVEESVREPALYATENHRKVEALGRICLSLGVRHFVFSSTSAVYGSRTAGAVSEDSPTVPESPYGSTKLAAERELFGLAEGGKMRVCALRYFNVAGATATLGQANSKVHSLVSVCADAALGRRSGVTIHGSDYPTPDGTGVRDYIHVADLARAHFDVLLYLEGGGISGVFNCGYGRPYSVREVIAAMEKVCGRSIPVTKGPRRPGDIPSIFADADKLKQLTGWRPRFDDLDEICRSAYDWERIRPVGSDA